MSREERWAKIIYEVIRKKIPTGRWDEFARVGLEMSQNMLTRIHKDAMGNYEDEQYRTIQMWREFHGFGKSPEQLLEIVDHFMRPNSPQVAVQPTEGRDTNGSRGRMSTDRDPGTSLASNSTINNMNIFGDVTVTGTARTKH